MTSYIYSIISTVFESCNACRWNLFREPEASCHLLTKVSFVERERQGRTILCRDFRGCVFGDVLDVLVPEDKEKLMKASGPEEIEAVLSNATFQSEARCAKHDRLCPVSSAIRPDFSLFGAPCVDDSPMGANLKDLGDSRKVIRTALHFFCMFMISILLSLWHDFLIYLGLMSSVGSGACAIHLSLLRWSLVNSWMQVTLAHLKFLNTELRPRAAISENVSAGNINQRICEKLAPTMSSKACLGMHMTWSMTWGLHTCLRQDFSNLLCFPCRSFSQSLLTLVLAASPAAEYSRSSLIAKLGVLWETHRIFMTESARSSRPNRSTCQTCSGQIQHLFRRKWGRWWQMPRRTATELLIPFWHPMNSKTSNCTRRNWMRSAHRRITCYSSLSLPKTRISWPKWVQTASCQHSLPRTKLCTREAATGWWQPWRNLQRIHSQWHENWLMQWRCKILDFSYECIKMFGMNVCVQGPCHVLWWM